MHLQSDSSQYPETPGTMTSHADMMEYENGPHLELPIVNNVGNIDRKDILKDVKNNDDQEQSDMNDQMTFVG